MTHDQALVWRYIQGNNPQESSKPLLIKLRQPSPRPQGPLPFGLVVPTSAEPAFLVIMPVNGSVTYWESLSSAASIDLNRQKQQGTQGSVGGMMAGEIIIRVTEGEPHGFVLTFNTGRVAHMTVCDPQGKPLISVQYLQRSGAHSKGVFGSLRNVLYNPAWRRNVAAVKAGRSWQRGQRYALIATTKGAFEIWDLNWNGTHSLEYEIDAKMDMLKSIQLYRAMPKDEDEHLFEVLDFAFLPNENSAEELAKANKKGSCKLLVLTVLKGVDSSRYTLVGLSMHKGSFNVDLVRPIPCYTNPVKVETEFRPQLLVPEPAQTAFVIFENSVVLLSLVEIEESPSSQLRIEAHTLPDPFQDVIDFHKNKDYRVVGCAAEPVDRGQVHSSCILMVYGFGIVRITALPAEEGQSAFDRATVTAKTKIEQAVFYGSIQQDLLDFSGRPEITFGEEEVEEAALEVSESIMKSTSAYISPMSTNMEEHLQLRSAALAGLMKHLVKHYKPLSRLTRWQLLWNAEKMAASKAVCHRYNSALSTKREGDKNLLTEVVDMLHQNFKVEVDPEKYETDAVRHWFIHDTWRLEYIIPWAQHAVEQLFKESVEDGIEHDSATQARLLSEANDIQISALETAFKFREANAALYGMSDEKMMDGVLLSGYEDLPEIWTSRANIVEKVKILVDLSREMAVKHDDEEDESMIKIIEKLMADNSRQVQLCCQTYIERFRWLKASDDPEFKSLGKELKKSHFQVRKVLFVKLSDIGLGQEGIKLAEHYQDMGALADIIHHGMEEATQRLSQPGVPDSEREEACQIIELIKGQISSYFVRFGHAWADAYFSKHIYRGKSIEILNNTPSYKEHLTHFLRSNPQYAKLSWINEIHSEHNYVAAADSLRVTQKQETGLWSKKIELSMEKLAILAAKCKKQVDDDSVEAAIQSVDKSVAVLAVQEKLYNYIRPILKGAIDATAEADLAMEQYWKRYVKSKSALYSTLKDNVDRLTARQALDSEQLIDTLTLMDGDCLYPDGESFADHRFFTALNLLHLTTFDEGEFARKALHEKIIWRRCINQDDWEGINRSELKDDTQVEVETGATALFKTLRECYRTGTLHFMHFPHLISSSYVASAQHRLPDFFLNTQPPSPSSLLSAGTSVASLRSSSRYTGYPDNSLVLLASDFASEDALLEQHMEKGRLEMWWRGVTDAALRSARYERDQDGENIRRRKSVEQGIRSSMSKQDKEWVRSQVADVELEVEVDGQGDVVMEG